MFKKWEEIKKYIWYYLEYIQNYIVESHLFNLLKERYQSYPLLHQKVIKYGLIGLIMLLICLPPMYAFYVSSKHWFRFQDKHKLSLDLLKIRNYKSNFANHTEYSIRNDISQIIQKYKEKDFVIKDSIGSIKEPSLKKVIYEAKVNNLNVRQVAQMGAELNRIKSVHLQTLEMTESTSYPKHYNTSFVLDAYFSKVSQKPTQHLNPKPVRNKIKPTKRNRDNTKALPINKKAGKKDISFQPANEVPLR